jgi:hypothetical protein
LNLAKQFWATQNIENDTLALIAAKSDKCSQFMKLLLNTSLQHEKEINQCKTTPSIVTIEFLLQSFPQTDQFGDDPRIAENVFDFDWLGYLNMTHGICTKWLYHAYGWDENGNSRVSKNKRNKFLADLKLAEDDQPKLCLAISTLLRREKTKCDNFLNKVYHGIYTELSKFWFPIEELVKLKNSLVLDNKSKVGRYPCSLTELPDQVLAHQQKILKSNHNLLRRDNCQCTNTHYTVEYSQTDIVSNQMREKPPKYMKQSQTDNNVMEDNLALQTIVFNSDKRETTLTQNSQTPSSNLATPLCPPNPFQNICGMQTRTSSPITSYEVNIVSPEESPQNTITTNHTIISGLPDYLQFNHNLFDNSSDKTSKSVDQISCVNEAYSIQEVVYIVNS